MQLHEVTRSMKFIPFYLSVANEYGVNSPQRQALDKVEFRNIKPEDKQLAEEILSSAVDVKIKRDDLARAKRYDRGAAEADYQYSLSETQMIDKLKKVPTVYSAQTSNLVIHELSNKNIHKTRPAKTLDNQEIAREIYNYEDDQIDFLTTFVEDIKLSGVDINLFDDGQMVDDVITYLESKDQMIDLEEELNRPQTEDEMIQLQLAINAIERGQQEFEEKYPNLEPTKQTYSVNDFPKVTDGLAKPYEITDENYDSFAAEVEMLRDPGLVK